MNAGIPIVASDIESHVSIAQKTDALILVDPYSPESIAQGIMKLLKNPDMMIRMGKNARYWAEKVFNADQEFSKLSEIYGKLEVS